MKYLLDSNVMINSAKPELAELGLQGWISNPESMVSAISQVEVLGFHALLPAAKTYFEATFGLLPVIAVSAEIIAVAIRFGQLHQLRAADAIIAASAWLHGCTLVTEDARFRRVLGLEVITPSAG